MALHPSHQYDDIINLSRPASRHPKMFPEDRAKIFSPFAALRGYEEAIKSKEKLRVNKAELSEEEKARIDQKLHLLEEGQRITVVYFHRDPGPDGSGGIGEGMYITVSGVLEKVDQALGVIVVDGVSIEFDAVAEVG